MQKGEGMSFAEFAYPLMQGWDWFRLLSSRQVQMQIGGSDQFGNIVSGIEIVKTARASEPDPAAKLPMESVYDDPVGFTVPLLTDSSGTKFGKSAGNAIWLDHFKTPVFDLYGYFVRRPDDEVEKLLKLFTFLPIETIKKTMEENRADPSKRVAHHLLAYEVVCLVSGEAAAREVQGQHRLMYRKDILPQAAETASNGDEFTAVEGQPTTPNNKPRIDMQLPRSLVLGDSPKSIARILYASRLAVSVSDGHRLASSGGAYIGASPGQKANVNKGMSTEHLQFTPVKVWFPQDTKNFLINDSLLILRKGKHNIRVVEVVSDDEYKASGQVYPGQPYVGEARILKENLKLLRQELGEEATFEDEPREADVPRSANRVLRGSQNMMEKRKAMVGELQRRIRGVETKRQRQADTAGLRKKWSAPGDADAGESIEGDAEAAEGKPDETGSR